MSDASVCTRNVKLGSVFLITVDEVKVVFDFGNAVSAATLHSIVSDSPFFVRLVSGSAIWVKSLMNLL